jgi:hypothetical protein
MNRTWEWRNHKTGVRIRQWYNLYENVFGMDKEDIPRNRYAKHSNSCDHHELCIWDRRYHKYRTHRSKIKRLSEKLEVAGIKPMKVGF